MKISTLITCLLIVFSLLLVVGCTQQDNTIVMTIKELENDQMTNISQDYSTYSISFKSLDDGDPVALKGVVSDVVYDSGNDTSYVLFAGDYNFSFFDYSIINFEGDLIGSFNPGDEVKILLTVKHVTVPIELAGFGINYDIELFEEQWVDTDYFKTNMLTGNPFKSLSQDLIEKI